MDVRLVYFGTSGRRREVHLHNGIVSVGRAEECELRIPADTVSRRHCQIELAGNEVVLTDMGSSNGTVVNGKPVIDDDIILNAGDKIEIGPATFVVVIDGKGLKGAAKASVGKAPAAQAEPAQAEPNVDAAVEEALEGNDLDDSFDPFSMLEDMGLDEDEEGDDDDIPPQPKQAVIPRGEPNEKKGPPGPADKDNQAGK